MIKVACAIIKNNNHYLLAKRSASMEHPEHWEFPGGKILSHESAKQAIMREIKEELNALVRPIKMEEPLHWVYPNKEIELIAVHCELLSKKIELTEHAAWQWMTAEELEDCQLLEADRALFQQITSSS